MSEAIVNGGLEVLAFFATYHARARGVKIVFGDTVKVFHGNGRSQRLMTSAGKELALVLPRRHRSVSVSRARLSSF